MNHNSFPSGGEQDSSRQGDKSPAEILANEPSFSKHMESMRRESAGTTEPTPEPPHSTGPTNSAREDNVSNNMEDDYRSRYFNDIMHRDANSRDRLDFAARHDLSPERQEEILNAEIAVESANDELLNELTSDESTMRSALDKNVAANEARSEAVETTLVKTIEGEHKE